MDIQENKKLIIGIGIGVVVITSATIFYFHKKKQSTSMTAGAKYGASLSDATPQTGNQSGTPSSASSPTLQIGDAMIIGQQIYNATVQAQTFPDGQRKTTFLTWDKFPDSVKALVTKLNSSGYIYTPNDQNNNPKRQIKNVGGLPMFIIPFTDTSFAKAVAAGEDITQMSPSSISYIQQGIINKTIK